MDELFNYLDEYGNAIRKIRISPDGQTFELADDGVPAMIVGVDDGEGTFDACAYFADDPGKWWLGLGTATILGERAIWRAVEDGNPIELVGTPETWLRRTVIEGGRFACIINWKVDPRLNLGWVRAVRCESEALRERLEDAIARHRVPFIIETCGSGEVVRPEARHAA